MLDKHSWHAPHQLDVNWEWLLDEYGEAKARTIRYELEYYNAYGRLPDDAVVLERIEWVKNNAIIIHRDPDEVRH
jgi:hypothetical protein